LEPKEEDIEEILIDDEDLGVEVEDVEVEGSNPITKFSEYVPLYLGWVPFLKMEDWDLADHEKFLHLVIE